MTLADHQPVTRQDFASLRRGGLNWQSLPLRLFMKGNARFWDPTAIDMTRDAADWYELDAEQQRLSLIHI